MQGEPQQQEAANMISIEEAKAKVPDKKALYEALLRNGYYMPPYSCRIVTVVYMDKVKSGEVYVPKYDIIRLRPCPNPPVKKRVFDEIGLIVRNFSTN